MDNTDLVLKARSFALERHKNQKKQDSETPFHTHLEGVVNRLKNLGVTNEDVLSAGWLHDIIERTDTTFDEINERFGNSISVLVLALTKDYNLPRKSMETQYIQQLQAASVEAKLIKFCDISTNLKEISVAPTSKNQKFKKIKKMFHYLRVIKNDLTKIKEEYPRLDELIDGINTVGNKFRQRPIRI